MYGKDSLNDFRCNLVSFLGNGLSWRLSVLVVHGIGLIVILSPPRHKGTKRSEGNAVDPVLYQYTVKVDQQAQPVAGEFEVGQHLRFVNREERVHSLEFDHNPVLHDEVEPQSGIQAKAIVDHRQ